MSVLLFSFLVNSHQQYSKKEGGIIETINDFGFDLLKVFNEQEGLKDENIFYSPTSVAYALAMVFLGANGNTAQEIAQVLKWYQYEFEDVHLTFKSLHEAIQEVENERLELKMANRIWGLSRLEETEDFRLSAMEFYNSSVMKVDFETSSDKAREEINKWVEQNTGRKIREFLSAGSVNSDTRLALINAIYFKGAWLNAFKREKTHQTRFRVPNDLGKVHEAEMMSRTAKYNYFSDDNYECQILELPFSGNEVSMIVILPSEIDGMRKVERVINTTLLSRWIALLENITVEVSIPKFLLSQQFELKTILHKLGIKDLFDFGLADLSGMTSEENLHVSQFVHKAHIEVNEQGAEAAAATGVVVQKRSIDLHPVFYADHPFLFLIYHMTSRTILFVGHVVHPSVMVEQEELHEQLQPLFSSHEAGEL